MVKNFIILIYLLFTNVCSYSNIQINDSLTKADLSVAISETFVGIKEIGNNQGFDNKPFERMMKTVGWWPGAAWCAFSLKLVYLLSGIETTITGWSPTAYNKENVVYTNGKLYKSIKPGDAGTLSYNKFKKNKNRYKGIGHAFLIVGMKGSKSVYTREGNTDMNGSAEGNGYYNKIRPLQSNLHITRWEK